MLTKSIHLALLPLLFATGCGAAHGGVLTFQGVTFTSTATGNPLSFEINAAHPLGDWASATTIDPFRFALTGESLGLDEPPPKVTFFANDSLKKAEILKAIPAGDMPPAPSPTPLPPIPVSEPRSVATMLGGLALMGMLVRRRKAGARKDA
jgi:hypothetical protein